MADPALHWLHLDEHLLVVAKPAGLLAVPGRGPDKADCLSARVQAHVGDALIVHRLDMATSGLMLMARSLQVQRDLGQAFIARQVHKRYEAVVHGHPPCEPGAWQEIDLPLGADWPQRPRQKVDPERGKPSLTRWQLLGREGAHSRLLLEPVTGRTHQLRVHLLALGHPIVGDELYAPDAPPSARLLLHARELAFTHPASGQPMRFAQAAGF